MTKFRLLLTVLAALILGAVVFFRVFAKDPNLTAEQESAAGQAEIENVQTIATISSAELLGDSLRLSGLNAPNAEVLILRDQEILAQPKTGDSGEWQVRLDLPSLTLPNPDQSGAVEINRRENLISLNAATRLADGRTILSDQAVKVIRYYAPRPVLADRVDVDPERSAPEAPADQGAMGRLQSAILRTEPGRPTRVVSSPFAQQVRGGPLSLMAIDYDDAGGVIVTGNLSEAGRIRVFANQAILGETGRDDQGNWQLVSTSTLPVGRYALRLIAFNPQAEIIGQLTVPFERKTPVPTQGQDGEITAQYSQQFWHISRSLFGGGAQQTVIYNGAAYGDAAIDLDQDPESNPESDVTAQER